MLDYERLTGIALVVVYKLTLTCNGHLYRNYFCNGIIPRVNNREN